MSEILQGLATLIKQSDLSKEEQKNSLDYFNQVAANELTSIVETFKNSPQLFGKFWRVLYLKSIFLGLIDNTKTLSEKEKDDLTDSISKMDEDEFTTFINTLTDAKNTEDVTKKIKETFEAYKKINSEIIDLTNKLAKS